MHGTYWVVGVTGVCCATFSVLVGVFKVLCFDRLLLDGTFGFALSFWRFP